MCRISVFLPFLLILASFHNVWSQIFEMVSLFMEIISIFLLPCLLWRYFLCLWLYLTFLLLFLVVKYELCVFLLSIANICFLLLEKLEHGKHTGTLPIKRHYCPKLRASIYPEKIMKSQNVDELMTPHPKKKLLTKHHL